VPPASSQSLTSPLGRRPGKSTIATPQATEVRRYRLCVIMAGIVIVGEDMDAAAREEFVVVRPPFRFSRLAVVSALRSATRVGRGDQTKPGEAIGVFLAFGSEYKIIDGCREQLGQAIDNLSHTLR
jgi:hypothetical protein